MEKSRLIIIILVVLLIAVGIFLVVNILKINKLNNENNQLRIEKSQVESDRDKYLADNKELRDQMQMLQQDVEKIYKSCITQNACKGHFPGIRWSCNNVGDAVNGDMASHVCVCDSSCNLVATQVKTI